MESIVAGSYDRFLFGFQCSTSGRTEETDLKRTFTYPAHKGPVKCLATSAPYLVSGGADDLIHLYDLQSDVDLGFLMSPGDGAVSALAFHATEKTRHPSHLFSGAADGSLSIWQAGGEWVCLKTFHGHKKEVNSIAVHPSGRLALSVSRDSSLRLWNLVKGKSAHESSLSQPAEQVAFSPDGRSYALVQGLQVSLQDIGAAPKAEMAHSRRALCLSYPTENMILTGSEEGSIRLWDTRAGSSPVIHIPRAHQSRVKGIAPSSTTAAELGLVSSASSDGVVKLWDFRKLTAEPQGQATALRQTATGARLTCLGSFDPSAATSGKSSAPIQAVSQGAVQTQKASKDSAAGRSVKERPAVEKALKAKATVGIAHDGVVDFAEAVVPNKGRHKQQQKPAKLQRRAVNTKLAKGNSNSSSHRGRQTRKVAGIKGTPMKRRQQS